jgi:hypothetical protein
MNLKPHEGNVLKGRVVVTQELIDADYVPVGLGTAKGVFYRCYTCPVAKALLITFPLAARVHVDMNFLRVYDGLQRMYIADTPSTVAEFMDLLDTGQEVRPISFDVTLARLSY